MTVTESKSKTIQCKECEGLGNTLDWFEGLRKDSNSMVKDCSTCEGTGSVTLHLKACSCGTVEWMDGGACSDCIEKAVQDIVGLFSLTKETVK